jgi:hypothetical protein
MTSWADDVEEEVAAGMLRLECGWLVVHFSVLPTCAFPVPVLLPPALSLRLASNYTAQARMM